MKARGLPGTFWPSESQLLLLRTVLAGEAEASEAWGRLDTIFDLDRLEEGSYALMPLLYRRLTDLGIRHPFLPRLKGIHRRTWYRNRMVLERTRSIVRACGPEIDALVMGAAALAIRAYAEPALREIAPIELLVRADGARRAVEAVTRDAGGAAEPAIASRLVRSGSVRIAVPERVPCIVHLGLLPGADPATSQPIFETSATADLDGERVRMLSPADELLRTCVLGARRTFVPSIAWVADAAAIVRSSPTLDWEALIRRAGRYRCAMSLMDAFVYLRAELGVAVPPEVVDELGARRAGKRDVAAHWLSGSGGTIGAAFAPYLQASGRGVAGALAAFPGYLRDSLGVDRTWQVPIAAARRRRARRAGRREW